MKKVLVTFAALALCTASFAQVPRLSKGRLHPSIEQQQQARQAKRDAIAKLGRRSDSSTTCDFPFTTGTGNTFLSYCVSSNGNILAIQAPEGHAQLSFDQFEGYGFCDANTNVAYFDFGGSGDSGNWGPATVLSRSANSVKIARITSDGSWSLTQTFTLVSGNSPEVKVAMAIKNNTGVPREAVLMRYADVDADGDSIDELDSTFASAMAYNSTFTGDGGAPFGLSLQNEGNTPFTFDAFSQSSFGAPNPCVPFLNAAGPLESVDGSIVQLYFVPLDARKSGTVTVSYRGM